MLSILWDFFFFLAAHYPELVMPSGVKNADSISSLSGIKPSTYTKKYFIILNTITPCFQNTSSKIYNPQALHLEIIIEYQRRYDFRDHQVQVS